MAVILDMFEYADHAAAQAAYPSSDPAYSGDICTGGTPSASSWHEPDETPSEAFDNNIHTEWAPESGTSYPHWIKYDFGSGVKKIAVRYTVMTRDADNLFPKDFTLQGSNNDTDWTDLDFRQTSGWSNSEKRTYTLAGEKIGAYRYYRWWWPNGYRTDDKRVQIAELELMGINVQCYSESAIKVQGSYSLKAVARMTGSLNDTLTRTVSPTINLADLTKIKFHIRASRTGTNIKVKIRDSGGTWSEYSIAISSADTWEAKEWDISGISNANKDAIDRIQFQIINAGSDNLFYLDNMFAGWAILTLTENLALLESLPTVHRKPPPFEEAIALKDVSSMPLGPDIVLEEALALKNVSNMPACPDIILREALALKESLTEISRALLLEEAIALKESLTEISRMLLLKEAIALKESLPMINRQLPPLEEAIALKEEVHAEALLFKVDKNGNITYMGTLNGGAF